VTDSSQAITRYPVLSRWLHWSMALLIVGMVFVGVAMVDSVATWQPTAVQLHKWLGLSLLVLVALRLVQRLRHPAPPLPADLPRLQALGARGAHVALYALMFAMPLVGWAMQGAAGTPVVLPGGWVLPALVAPDLATYGLLRDAHAVLAYTLFALVLLHAGAGLYHGLVRRDGVLESMTGAAAPVEEPPMVAIDDATTTPAPASSPGESRPGEGG
jgi:cytochrome b561